MVSVWGSQVSSTRVRSKNSSLISMSASTTTPARVSYALVVTASAVRSYGQPVECATTTFLLSPFCP